MKTTTTSAKETKQQQNRSYKTKIATNQPANQAHTHTHTHTHTHWKQGFPCSWHSGQENMFSLVHCKLTSGKRRRIYSLHTAGGKRRQLLLCSRNFRQTECKRPCSERVDCSKRTPLWERKLTVTGPRDARALTPSTGLRPRCRKAMLGVTP